MPGSDQARRLEKRDVKGSEGAIKKKAISQETQINLLAMDLRRDKLNLGKYGEDKKWRLGS